MRRPVLLLSLVAAPACAWFTDFDSLSEPSPENDAGTDAPVTEDAGSTPDATANDGAGRDAALSPNVLFADDFDDATPLPRAWDRASGGPTIEAVNDAPSQPNALVVYSPKAAPVAPFLEKSVTTNGASAVKFSFRIKELQYGGSAYTRIARVTFPNQRTCTLERSQFEHKVYCQMNGLGKTAFANFAAGSWVELGMRWSSTGRIDVFAGLANGFVQYTPEEIGPLESPVFQVGLVAANGEIDWRAYYDDVKIERE